MVDTKILSNNMKFEMKHDILEHDQMQWHPPLIRHYTYSWPCLNLVTEADIFTELRVVSIEHLQRARHANRGRLLLCIPRPLQFWDLHNLNVETSPSDSCHAFRFLNFEYPLLLLFCLNELKFKEAKFKTAY